MQEFALAAAETIAAAAQAPGLWQDAFLALANATGGWGCHLICVEDGALTRSGGAGAPNGFFFEYATRMAGDLSRDPRLALLAIGSVGDVFGDSDLTADRRGRPSPFREFLDRAGAAFFIGLHVLDEAGAKLFALIMRSAEQGPPNLQELATLRALAPNLREALGRQMRLEAQASAVAFRVLAGAQVGAVLCAPSGRVISATKAARDLLNSAEVLWEKQGRLAARDAQSDRRLQAAIESAAYAAAAPGSAPSPVVVLNTDETSALLAEVMPVQAEDSPFQLPGRVLVVLGGPTRDGSGVLRLHFGLTPAEAEVAIALANGHSPGDIAQRRKVSIATVRAQISTVFSKLRVTRAGEMTAKVRGFL